MRVLLAFLLAASAARASASGAGEPGAFDPAAILDRDDPGAARAFLGDAPLQNKLKSRDADLYVRIFARSVELKDLADLVEIPPQSDAYGNPLRTGLLARSGCRFCQKPGEMEAWARKYLDPAHAPPDRLKEALLDWNTLDRRQQEWLLAHASTESEWAAMDLYSRHERLLGWAGDETKALMALNPSTPGELDAMQRRIDPAIDILGWPEGAPLWNRYEQARAAVDSLDRARKEFAETDSRLKEALNAATLDARLDALNRLFDAGGRDGGSLAAAAPARKGQSFDNHSRWVVAGLLASGLMRMIEGTWAQSDLKDFFANHPLNILVRERPEGTLAEHKDGKLIFNERYIERYVKARGRTLDDLAKDVGLLEPLLRELAPVFVHEATHLRQDEWAQEHGLPLPFWSGEAVEAEAKMAEALFVLQKTKLDPSYLKFLENLQGTSVYAGESLLLARRLEKDRAERFSRDILLREYARTPTLAGKAGAETAELEKDLALIRQEVERRRGLPRDEQEALQSSRSYAPYYDSIRDLVTVLQDVGTPRLEALADEVHRELLRQPEIYAKYQARLDEAKRLTDLRLDQLASSPPEPRDKVPPPL